MSGISSALWSGVSGINVFGTQLGIIGTDISNSGSIGYRGTTGYAAGGFGGQLSSLAGQKSIGQGASLSTVYTDFSSGTGLSSSSSTHVAIGGAGMFGVRNPNSEEIFYTRRGDFGFNSEGFLTSSEGYRVQGWPIESNGLSIGGTGTSTGPVSRIKGTGVPADIQSPGDTSPPEHTTSMDIINNLGASSGAGNSTDIANPYFAVMQKWNGTATPPIGSNAYSYQNTIKVYDESGSSHDITVYFDKVGEVGGTGEDWEFIVTMPPHEDKRVLGGVPVTLGDPSAVPPVPGNPVAGLLMSGTMQFSSGGQLDNMTAFVPDAASAAGALDPTAPASLANWDAAPLSQNGIPMFFPNFAGDPSPSANGATVGGLTPKNAIEINFGLHSSSASWDPTITNAAAIGATKLTAGMALPKQDTKSTTNYAGTSSTTFQNADGNTFGLLQDIQVDKEGVITALYSNGTKIDFAQISLYSFPDLQGLEYTNGSIYRGTKASGMGTPGVAGEGGRGALQNYLLEQSNVDLSEELTQMIVAQNSYTACTKIITAANQALASVINMV